MLSMLKVSTKFLPSSTTVSTKTKLNSNLRLLYDQNMLTAHVQFDAYAIFTLSCKPRYEFRQEKMYVEGKKKRALGAQKW